MICVVDYGMGNLRSVGKALERLGAKVLISNKASDLKRADKVVLPGVGEFGSAMQELKTRHLIAPLLNHIQMQKPFLGICLGMQLLLESSSESPSIKGLGVLEGKVKSLKKKISNKLKVPQMGWNQVEFTRPSPLTKGLKKKPYFYFVHSYYADPEQNQSVLGVTRYGMKFASILENGPVFAVQFHPEKSQESGLTILKNFITY